MPPRILREHLPTSNYDEPLAAARWLRGEPRPLVLAGAWSAGELILSSHPLLSAKATRDPFALLDGLPPGLGPFDDWEDDGFVGGGWFGWLGFQLARLVESLPPPPPRRDPQLVPFGLAFHDHLIRRDAAGHWWFEALCSDARAEFLSERLREWRCRLAEPAPPAGEYAAGPVRATGAGLAGHRAAVAETVARIAAGDMSQTNVCMALETELDGDPLDLWIKAASVASPAYAAYIGAGDDGHAVLSLSPELFLRRRGRDVMTRPIKGTAPQEEDPSRLGGSDKDRAENVMIVDLMRNDLGRVCDYGSVTVPELNAVIAAPGVWHLESTVTGMLRRGVSDRELLRATFPPGSVTGAPKVQALRTITELESTAREAYCGAIGLRSPCTGLELSVAIRTLEVLPDGRLWLGVGGGIVSDSDPDNEVEEAITKARGTLAPAGIGLSSTLRVRTAAASASPLAFPVSRLSRPDPELGVFETILAADGVAVRLPRHLDRLFASCASLGLPSPASLAAEVIDAAGELGAGAIRVEVSHAGSVVRTRALPEGEVTELRPVIVPGGLGAHKWADRTLINALSGPGYTPLICDLDGAVLEAGYAAVLAVRDGVLTAPVLDGRQLASISREVALAAARDEGLSVVVGSLTLADLQRADQILLTSSLRGTHLGRLAT